MFEIPILKKINILLSVFSNKIFILLFLLFIFFTVFMIFTKRKKMFFFIFLLLIISILSFISYNKLYMFFDYFVDTLFTTMYFPNFTLYNALIFIINIIMVKNILNKKSNITTVMYYTLMFIFILTIYTIKNNNIIISDKVSIYSNATILTLIETTSFLFTIYLLLKLIIYLIKKFKFKKNIKLEKIEIKPAKKIPFIINQINYKEINVTNYYKTNKNLINLFKKNI